MTCSIPTITHWGEGNGNLISGLAKTSETKGNNRITWEQTYEYNAGFDLSILNNRIPDSGRILLHHQTVIIQTAGSFFHRIQ